MINVYVIIDSETAPMAWAWGEYGNAFEAWPGVAMTAEGDMWKIEVPKGTTGFIANNGNGTQTSDITIDGTKDCWITVSADYKTVEVSYEAPAGGEIEPPAQTGDMSIAGLALAALAATAGLVVMKKKEN
jgi:LPXTG-motif cell wall-anchored protein